MGYNMVGLLTTIVGVIILTVLADIMLPEGQTSKYIKFVIGIIVVYVMIGGIVAFFGSAEIATDVCNYDVELDDAYMLYVSKTTCDSYASRCISALDSVGYRGAEVAVICSIDNYSVNIKRVDINISKCGISKEKDNIDIVVHDIVSTISYLLSIDTSQVSVCQ